MAREAFIEKNFRPEKLARIAQANEIIQVVTFLEDDS